MSEKCYLLFQLRKWSLGWKWCTWGLQYHRGTMEIEEYNGYGDQWRAMSLGGPCRDQYCLRSSHRRWDGARPQQVGRRHQAERCDAVPRDPTHGQDLALGLVEGHEVHMGSLCDLVEACSVVTRRRRKRAAWREMMYLWEMLTTTR